MEVSSFFTSKKSKAANGSDFISAFFEVGGSDLKLKPNSIFFYLIELFSVIYVTLDPALDD
jgi:hypothetical protein